ncbi:MAG TPA: NAD(P)-binding domain-containing protein [Sphingomonas sp.]|nr:NAD(P)-binding domain-containing protein [Sphingomonas sp.]
MGDFAMTDVSVIGLGQMGVRLVELLREAGRTVMVWNRSAAKAAATGAELAGSPAEAVMASSVTLVIVADDEAVGAILDSPGMTAAAAGRILVNLGTSGPDAARGFAGQVTAAGGSYVDGAIQAAPSQMGQPDTPVLLAGSRRAYAAVEPLLGILAGNLVYLGEEPDAVAYMDLATLSYVYGAYAGFLHGARIAEATGIDPAVYGRLVNAISPSFGAFFEHQGGVIASGDFAISESPMRISVAAVDRIARASAALGINRELPDLVDGWLARADAQGLADQELAALIKVLRGEPESIAA